MSNKACSGDTYHQVQIYLYIELYITIIDIVCHITLIFTCVTENGILSHAINLILSSF